MDKTNEEKEINLYLLVLLVLLAIAWCTAWTINIPEDEELVDYLNKKGYEEITLTGIRLFNHGCSNKDAYAVGFKSRRRVDDGTLLTGVVCQGATGSRNILLTK